MEFNRAGGNKFLNQWGLIIFYIGAMIAIFMIHQQIDMANALLEINISKTQFLQYSIVFLIIILPIFILHNRNENSKIMIECGTITAFQRKFLALKEIGSLQISDIDYICKKNYDIVNSHGHKTHSENYYLIDKEGKERLLIDTTLMYQEGIKDLLILDYLTNDLGFQIREEEAILSKTLNKMTYIIYWAIITYFLYIILKIIIIAINGG